MNDRPEHIEPTDRKWAKMTADNAARPYPGPPLISFADLDRWAEEEEHARYALREEEIMNWNEANAVGDYMDVDPEPYE